MKRMKLSGSIRKFLLVKKALLRRSFSAEEAETKIQQLVSDTFAAYNKGRAEKTK